MIEKFLQDTDTNSDSSTQFSSCSESCIGAEPMLAMKVTRDSQLSYVHSL